MSETKFTPGPWYVGGNGGFINQLQIEPTIGCVYGAGDELKANAHLIAAAPDLFAALERVESMRDDAYLTGHSEWAEIVQAARNDLLRFQICFQRKIG